MSTHGVRHPRGAKVKAFSATLAKNAFGNVLEKALADGMVLITRHDTARAVLLSVEEYQALLARVPDPLQALGAEFESLVTNMRKPKARMAARMLFKATGAELGKAAVTGARKRG
ncbi:MAG: type II toxin-antitoxin system prevent-host-death family antitoxin [Gammaproteobacteria bacterium]|nr:type II toxin-antitoxin system prevent-host-death family antitoxin [Gammaproteobacteria bacterium]MDE2023022.1 type II toxin-antitoxin system Phd/YefM family antitoxin [Gammaproteobacteria bacterium]